jgi:hypothetical protein
MTVLVKGISSANRSLGAYAAKLAAPVAMFEQIAQELSVAEQAWFTAEGEGSWQPLSLQYAARKSREYPGQPILVASGELRDWLVNPAKAMRITSPETMQWVNDRNTPDGRWNLAELHRDGTPTMPARDPVIPAARLNEIALAAAEIHARFR